MDDLDAAVRGEVDEAIRSAANESVVSIYRRFGLATRGIGDSAFLKYARRLRQQARLVSAQDDRLLAGPTNGAGPANVADPAEIARLIDRNILETLQAGGLKPHELAALKARCQEEDRIAIIREAEARAAEMHEIKIAELRKMQADALGVTAKTANLTPEQVAEIRLKVLGLA